MSREDITEDQDELYDEVEDFEGELVEGTEEDEDEDEDEMDESVEDDAEEANASTAASIKKSAPSKTTEKPTGAKDGMKKISNKMEDIDFEDDLNALVESEATLSEGFRAKASVIFEAALKSKLSEQLDRLEEEYEENLIEAVETYKTELVDKVDGYLNYVVESWMEENKLAVESGIRTEIAESFISQLHKVFEEHYVEVPETKVDLVDELANKVEALEEDYNTEVTKNIELVEANKELTREKIIRESSEGLSEIESEKLKSLSEDIDFVDAESFTGKISTLKESYFGKKIKAPDASVEEELNESTQEVSSSMQAYLNALKN